MPPWDHNPFVLVNYSPTICLNPSPLIGMESWPIAVGQEKRYDGGPVQSHVQIGSAAVGRDPADGAWPYSRRAPARGVFERAAVARPVFQSVRRLATGC